MGKQLSFLPAVSLSSTGNRDPSGGGGREEGGRKLLRPGLRTLNCSLSSERGLGLDYKGA